MTGTSRRSSPTIHQRVIPECIVPVLGVWGLAIRHTGRIQVGQWEQGSGNFLVSPPDRGQTVYRTALPRFCLWYAGYAIWITGCKIPSKEASWSQRCEAKLIHKEMSCWQPLCDRQNYFSIHGPVDRRNRGEIHICFSLFFLCVPAGGLSTMSRWVLFWGPWLWLVGVNTGWACLFLYP